MENGRFAFLNPLWGRELGATYDVHLRLIGKRVVDFLLALIELFLLVATAEALQRISTENWLFRSNGVSSPLDQKFQVEGVAPPTFLFLRKLG